MHQPRATPVASSETQESLAATSEENEDDGEARAGAGARAGARAGAGGVEGRTFQKSEEIRETFERCGKSLH